MKRHESWLYVFIMRAKLRTKALFSCARRSDRFDQQCCSIFESSAFPLADRVDIRTKKDKLKFAYD